MKTGKFIVLNVGKVLGGRTVFWIFGVDARVTIRFAKYYKKLINLLAVVTPEVPVDWRF